jgi:hypothetical protein
MAELAVSWEEFVKLQQLIAIVKEGQDQNLSDGEAKGDAGEVSWSPESVSLKVGEGD